MNIVNNVGNNINTYYDNLINTDLSENTDSQNKIKPLILKSEIKNIKQRNDDIPKDTERIIQDAEKLGMSRSSIIKELRLTKKEKTALLNGRYVPYRITDSVRQIFAENYAELEEKLGK